MQVEPWDPVPVEDGDYRALEFRGEDCPRCRGPLDEDFFCSLCGKLATARVPVDSGRADL